MPGMTSIELNGDSEFRADSGERYYYGDVKSAIVDEYLDRCYLRLRTAGAREIEVTVSRVIVRFAHAWWNQYRRAEHGPFQIRRLLGPNDVVDRAGVSGRVGVMPDDVFLPALNGEPFAYGEVVSQRVEIDPETGVGRFHLRGVSGGDRWEAEVPEAAFEEATRRYEMVTGRVNGGVSCGGLRKGGRQSTGTRSGGSESTRERSSRRYQIVG
jgi:hypothetical protein